jgi:uroporphyrinogen decarboxylase
MSLNHRERVLKSLNHESPDRLPIDLGGTGATGIMAPAYQRLTKHLEINSTPVRVSDMLQQLAEVEPAVLEHFGIDVVNIDNSSFDEDGGRSQWKPDPKNSSVLVPAWAEFEEEGGRRYLVAPDRGRMGVQPPDCPYFENIWKPLLDAETPEDVEKANWGAWGGKDFSTLAKRAKTLKEKSDRVVVMGFGGQMLEAGQDFLGFEKFMMEMAMDSPLAHAFLDRVNQVYEENLQGFIEQVAESVDVICFFDDLGTQNAPQISVKMFRKFFLSRYKNLFQTVKEKTDCYTFLHCCGSIKPFIPDLIEAGLDILNPVQISAAGMAPAELKKEFGRDLVFWGGGCDTQRILPTASPEEVRADVRKNIAALAPGGGFVFCPVHNIQADVPVENIVAMYDEALKFSY